MACPKRPERTTAAAYPLYLHGRVLADSAALHWSGLYVRRFLWSSSPVLALAANDERSPLYGAKEQDVRL
jgi:hypothetical protein